MFANSPDFRASPKGSVESKAVGVACVQAVTINSGKRKKKRSMRTPYHAIMGVW